MEVCGGQTHTIVRQGIHELLADQVEMIHGPGCPVCVTPLEQIDRALASRLAARRDLHLLRRHAARAGLATPTCSRSGARRRTCASSTRRSTRWTSPAVNPDREVVFFAVGFETTAPANAMAVWRAHQLGLANFSVLVSHVTVPPAMVAILESPDNRVQGFLAAGHVCTVMGWEEYEPLAARSTACRSS
jgi:hydrogenase expression/formation protein HypD